MTRNLLEQTQSCLLAVLALMLVISGAVGCSDDPEDSGCSDDSKCERGFICEEDACVEWQCASKLDCPGRDRTCVPDSGTCTPYECESELDCTDGLLCLDHLCVDNVPCSSRCGCPDGMICNIITGACGPAPNTCENDDHCPCNTACSDGGTCVEGCVSDEECISSMFCNTDSNQCESGCRSTSDCQDGETCVDNQCAFESCTPGSCGDGFQCNPTSGVCEVFGELGLCEPCENDDQCGSSADECTIISSNNESFCTTACDVDTPGSCGSGYVCYAVSSNSSQCIPVGNECKICHSEGCPPNMWCNSSSGECESVVDTCGQCSMEDQCQEGSSCAVLALRSYCFPQCPDSSCPSEYTCDENGVCMPDSGTCQSCDDLPACTPPTPYADEVNCRCVTCLDHSQCEDGLMCSPDFQSCYWSDTECASDGDCGPDKKCVGGLCVECISQMDCPDGQCIQGKCDICECDPGFRCDPMGNCVEIPEGCSSPADCIAPDGTQGNCDLVTASCYKPGSCGSVDPFFSECPAPLVCEELLPGFAAVCTGCDMLTIPCREEELCLFGSCITIDM